MSTMQTPPPDAGVPPGPPERRCPRCGSTLAPDQEWCLACGAAAGTEVVEARGWRVPLYLGGGLVALAILGIILLIAALSNREDVAGTPTPAPSAQPPGATVSPVPTSTPLPSVTPSPSPFETPTATPEESPTEVPTEDPPTDTGDGTGPSSTFSGWSGSDGDYTVIIESADSLEGAEKVAQDAQDAGHTVGVLDSNEYSSLNGGYYVVFSGTYASKSEAVDAVDALRSDYPDAYVKQIET